ncbi:MAG: hypothetical protein AAFV54_16990, partial [Pseudomonadota bacterium]
SAYAIDRSRLDWLGLQSHMLNANIVSDLRSVATMMLEQSERASWAASFGEPDVTGPARVAVITSAAENVNAPTKPWAR